MHEFHEARDRRARKTVEASRTSFASHHFDSRLANVNPL